MYLDSKEVYRTTKGNEPVPRIQEITVGAVNYKITSLYNANAIDLQFEYLRYLNSDVYAVRIYNRALTTKEVERNFLIDDARFLIKK